jgi:hypothetical protein
MSNDRYIIKESTLQSIGNSLRTKLKTSKQLTPKEFQPLLETLYSDATASNDLIRKDKIACTATAREIYKGYGAYEYKSGEDRGIMPDYAGEKVGGSLSYGSGTGPAEGQSSEGLLIEGTTLKGIGSCSDKRVVVPDGITTIAEKAFYGKYIEIVVLPESVTRIEEQAFSHSRLKSINLPENLTFLGDFAFRSCKLRTIVLPNSLKTLNNSTFSYCTCLESVELPNNLEYLDMSAFLNTSINSLYIPKSVKKIASFKNEEEEKTSS